LEAAANAERERIFKRSVVENASTEFDLVAIELDHALELRIASDLTLEGDFFWIFRRFISGGKRLGDDAFDALAIGVGLDDLDGEIDSLIEAHGSASAVHAFEAHLGIFFDSESEVAAFVADKIAKPRFVRQTGKLSDARQG